MNSFNRRNIPSASLLAVLFFGGLLMIGGCKSNTSEPTQGGETATLSAPTGQEMSAGQSTAPASADLQMSTPAAAGSDARTGNKR